MNFFSDPRTVCFTSPVIKERGGYMHCVTYLMPRRWSDQVGNPICPSCRSLEVDQAYDPVADTLDIACRSCGIKERWENDHTYGWLQLCDCGKPIRRLVYSEYYAILIHHCRCRRVCAHRYCGGSWFKVKAPRGSRLWTEDSP